MTLKQVPRRYPDTDELVWYSNPPNIIDRTYGWYCVRNAVIKNHLMWSSKLGITQAVHYWLKKGGPLQNSYDIYTSSEQGAWRLAPMDCIKEEIRQQAYEHNRTKALSDR